MAIVNIEITITYEWQKEPADCSACQACGDIIVGDRNDMYAFFNNKLAQNEPIISLCNACYEAVIS